MSATTPNTLARYHQLLMAVSDHAAGLTLPELARLTRLPRSSVHRIATSLCSVSYLEFDSRTGTYLLGSALTELLRRSLVADNRLPAFRPALEYLVSKLGETSFFARLTSSGVELAHAITPQKKNHSFVFPGIGPRSLDKCSSSKAILAYAESSKVEHLLTAGALTGASGVSASHEVLKSQLREVGRDGYAVCDGELDEGVFSVAVPVPVGPLFGLYSIGVVGMSSRMKARSLIEMVAFLREAAEMASGSLLDYIDGT